MALALAQIAAAGLAAALSLYFNSPAVAILSAAFILYLPGAAVLGALYPASKEWSLEDQLFWSVSFSLAVVVVLFLVLNELANLDQKWVLGAALVWIVFFSSVDYIRMLFQGTPASSVAVLQSSQSALKRNFEAEAGGPQVDQSKRWYGSPWLMLFAGLIVGLSLFISQTSVNATNPGTLEFWLLPRPSGDVSVGVRNRQSLPIQIVVRLSLTDGHEIDIWSLDLNPGKSWTTAVPRPSGIGLRATLAYQSDPNKTLEFLFLQKPPTPD